MFLWLPETGTERQTEMEMMIELIQRGRRRTTCNETDTDARSDKKEQKERKLMMIFEPLFFVHALDISEIILARLT